MEETNRDGLTDDSEDNIVDILEKTILIVKTSIQLLKKNLNIFPFIIILILIGIYVVSIHGKDVSSNINKTINQKAKEKDKIRLDQEFIENEYYPYNLIHSIYHEEYEEDLESKEILKSLSSILACKTDNYNSVFQLLAFLLLEGRNTEELKCNKYIIDTYFQEAITSQNSSQYRIYLNNYLDKIYCKSIKKSWELGLYYEAFDISELLRERFELLEFGSFIDVDDNVLEHNNEINLLLLLTRYPRTYSIRSEDAIILGKVILNDFKEEDIGMLKNYDLDPILVPLKNYLLGVYKMRKQEFHESYSYFENSYQQVRTEKHGTYLKEFSLLMLCRTMFWDYKYYKSPTAKDTFITEYEKAKREIGNKNLRKDLETYFQEIDKEFSREN